MPLALQYENRLEPPDHTADRSKQTINSIAAVVGTFSAAAFVKYSSWHWSYRFNVNIFANQID